MTATPAHVAILLCTYNGEHYLAQQLDSIGAQTHTHWTLWISDDSTREDTRAVVQRYIEKWGPERVCMVRGPQKGFAPNFLSLACREEIDADYFAYCDQDDIWHPWKIERALERLSSADRQGGATLYCSRTELMDDSGRSLGYSPHFTRPPDFRNALVQNIGGGNTMVFNRAARDVLLAAGPDLNVVAHDWWTYIAVSATGGRIEYDSNPTLLYRQHGNNLIGSNAGLSARTARIRGLMQGQLRRWTDANVDGLMRIRPRLSPANLRVLDRFLAARGKGVLGRLLGLRRAGIYRQTALGDLGLFVAALFKKI